MTTFMSSSAVAAWLLLATPAAAPPAGAPPAGASEPSAAPGAEPSAPAPPSARAELEAIRAALPRMAGPMREVGERFRDMVHGARAGNWALAAYMSKYMNGAMRPARLTKPEEHAAWEQFYRTDLEPLNAAIRAHDRSAFEKALRGAVRSCNACHSAMGYGFIEVTTPGPPADAGLRYRLRSRAADVPP
jgi:hypothetical protein